jgi:hypothetical protein
MTGLGKGQAEHGLGMGTGGNWAWTGHGHERDWARTGDRLSTVTGETGHRHGRARHGRIASERHGYPLLY